MKLVNVSTLRRHLLTLSDKYLKTNNFDGVLIVDDCVGVIDKMPEIKCPLVCPKCDAEMEGKKQWIG